MKVLLWSHQCIFHNHLQSFHFLTGSADFFFPLKWVKYPSQGRKVACYAYQMRKKISLNAFIFWNGINIAVRLFLKVHMKILHNSFELIILFCLFNPCEIFSTAKLVIFMTQRVLRDVIMYILRIYALGLVEYFKSNNKI